MNIYVYADESGVFDVAHNKLYTYGGVIYLSKEEKDIATRKYINVERNIYKSSKIDSSVELKANILSRKDKRSTFRSLNQTIKFGVAVDQEKIHKNIFADKKHKQRYLDFAFKMGLKNCFKKLIEKGHIIPEKVDNITIFLDEHSTATSGLYELKEGLEEEFKRGMFNPNYGIFHKPIFPHLSDIQVMYCNSMKKTLVRAADIVANRIWHDVLWGQMDKLQDNLYMHYEPTRVKGYADLSCYGINKDNV